MSNKMNGMNEMIAAIPAKTLGFLSAVGIGGAAVDGASRAPLLSELILFSIAGHGVTLSILAVLVGIVGGLVALLKPLAMLAHRWIWR